MNLCVITDVIRFTETDYDMDTHVSGKDVIAQRKNNYSMIIMLKMEVIVMNLWKRF